MQNTPLKEAIDRLTESKNFINADDSKEDRYYATGLKEAIYILTELLPKEKEEFQKVYSSAYSNGMNFPNEIVTDIEYFETNYKQ